MNIKEKINKLFTVAVGEWTSLDILCSKNIFILWALFGFFILWIYNAILPYIYLILFIIVIRNYTAQACQHCPHLTHGDCHLGLAKLAKKVYKHYSKPKHNKSASALLQLIGLSLFPVPFLLLYGKFGLMGFYLILTMAWYIFRHYALCCKCRNVNCILNQKYKEKAN